MWKPFLSSRITPTSMLFASIVPVLWWKCTFESLFQGEQSVMDGILDLHLRAVSPFKESLGVLRVLADSSSLPAVVGA